MTQNLLDPNSDSSTILPILSVTSSLNSNAVTVSLLDKVSICGREAYSTENSQIFVLRHRAHDQSVSDAYDFITADSVDVTEVLYNELASQISSIFLKTSLALDVSFTSIATRLCEARRLSIKNTLLNLQDGRATTISGNRLGLLAVVAGEVVHIIRGVPVPATIRQVEGCYRDIPIQVEGSFGHFQMLFARPVTRVILPTSPSVECSDLTPVMAFIESSNGGTGGWFCALKSGMLPCPAPGMASPVRAEARLWDDFDRSVTSGLYTQQQITSFISHQFSTSYSESVSAEIGLVLVNNLPRSTPNVRRWLKNLDSSTSTVLAQIGSPFHQLFSGLSVGVERALWTIMLVIIMICLALTACKLGAYLIAHGCAKKGLRLANLGSNIDMQNLNPLISTEDKMQELEERLARSEVQTGKLMLTLAENQRTLFKQNSSYPDVQVVR